MGVYKTCVIFFYIMFCLRTQACPPLCRCTATPPGRVVCNPGLTNFPQGMDVKTEAIILMGNHNSQNSISRLQRSHLTQFSGLDELYISFSGLTSVDDGAFANVAKLRRITLKYNRISKITKMTFHGLLHLETLDLSGNKGCLIETGSLSSLSTLLYLFLGDMKLSHLNTGMFSGLTSLRTLDLHGNEFFEINPDVLIGISSLMKLDLSSNQLVKLSASMESFLSKRHAILEDNPWHCNCELQWMKRVFKNGFSNVPHASNPAVCYTPKKIRYMTLIRVADDNMKCHPPQITQCDGPYRVDIGKDLTVTCLLEGDPFPDFFWTRPDKSSTKINKFNIISVEYMISQTVKINITHASLQHDGKWSISAKNKYGQKVKIFSVHIIVPTTTSTISTTTYVTSPELTTTVARVTEKINPGFLAAAAGFGLTTLVTCCTCICTARYVRKRNRTRPQYKPWHKGGHLDEVTIVVPKPPT